MCSDGAYQNRQFLNMQLHDNYVLNNPFYPTMPLAYIMHPKVNILCVANAEKFNIVYMNVHTLMYYMNIMYIPTAFQHEWCVGFWMVRVTLTWMN